MLTLLPCYSLETLSLERDSTEVNQLLSAWSALYHPALLEKTQKLPGWENAFSPQKEIVSQIVVVPPCADSSVPQEWFEAKNEAGTIVIRNLDNRNEIIDTILDATNLHDHGFDDEFVADFFAFGTSRLLTEIMTRRLQYMSYLDEPQLERNLLNATKEYRTNIRESAKSSLQSAFDQVTQSKEYIYPGSAYLLDLTLTSSATLGETLRNEIRSTPFTNLFLSTRQLQEIVEKEPETLALLRETLREEDNANDHSGDVVKRENIVQLIGDDLDTAPLPMLPIMEIADRLIQGLGLYRHILGVRPEFFGRSVRGFCPVMPQLLKLTGYRGVLHFTPLDGWHVPKETQSKAFWEGSDGTKIDAMLKFPFDATEHDTFFKLPKRLADSMNDDHASTFTLAHYPMKKSVWLDDLRRAGGFSSACGNFTKIKEYFENTKYIGVTKKYGYEKYWTNHLLNAIRDKRTGPVSDWAIYYRFLAEITAFGFLATFDAAVSHDKTQYETDRVELETRLDPILETIENRLFGPLDETAPQEQVTENKPEPKTEQKYSLEGLPPKLTWKDSPEATENAKVKQCNEISELLVSRLAFSVYGKPIEEVEKLPDDEIQKIVGIFVTNPLSYPRRVVVDISDLEHLPRENEQILLARQWNHEGEIRKEAVVEIPPLGYLWLGPDAPEEETSDEAAFDPKSASFQQTRRKPFVQRIQELFFSKQKNKRKGSAQEPPMVEFVEEKIEKRGSGVQTLKLYVLRNEIFEVRIDAATGEMRSITTPETRGTRFAHQLAFRCPEEQRKDDTRNEYSPNYGYTIMAADRFEIISSGPVVGKLRVHGRMVRQDGTVAAKYMETYTIKRKIRVLEIEIEIDPVLEPGEKPWDSYYAARFAWTDALDQPRGGIHSGTYSMDGNYLQTPEFLDFREGNLSMTLLTGGLPFHRIFEENRCDTILIPAGENARKFRIGIAVDTPAPVHAARDFLLSDFQANAMIPAPKHKTAWFFSTTSKNVIVQKIEPIFDEGDDERIAGFRVVLQEIANRTATFRFRTFLPMVRANRTDLLQTPGDDIPVENGEIRLEMHARELLPLEIHFSETMETPQ